MSARPELKALTSVRGIAAWMVVFYHIRRSVAYLPTPALDFFGKGYLAVDFFFLLSGFVIWMTYGERLRSGGLATVPEFLKRRVARIWPLHLVMLGFAVAVAVALTMTGRHDAIMFPFDELPLHVFLIQNWGFTDRLSWNDPAWSISAELGAYLLFPLLVMAVDWRRVSTLSLVGTVATLLLALHVILRANGIVSLGSDITGFGLIRCLFEFSAGTVICALWLRWRDRPALPALVTAALAVATFAGWLAGAVPETLAMPVTFAALLMALALTCGMRGNVLEVAPLHYLGEISYATYLSHFMLWFSFKLVLVNNAYAVGWHRIALFLMLVLVASAALYHLVERPAQRWINARSLPRFRTRGRERAVH